MPGYDINGRVVPLWRFDDAPPPKPVPLRAFRVSIDWLEHDGKRAEWNEYRNKVWYPLTLNFVVMAPSGGVACRMVHESPESNYDASICITDVEEI